MLGFGERLRLARERAGMTQLDVQKAIGLSNKSLSRYETGKTAPDPRTMTDLVRLYGVTGDYILGLTDVMGERPSAGTSRVRPMALEDIALAERLSSLPPDAKAKANEYVQMLQALSEVKSVDGSSTSQRKG